MDKRIVRAPLCDVSHQSRGRVGSLLPEGESPQVVTLRSPDGLAQTQKAAKNCNLILGRSQVLLRPIWILDNRGESC